MVYPSEKKVERCQVAGTKVITGCVQSAKVEGKNSSEEERL